MPANGGFAPGLPDGETEHLRDALAVAHGDLRLHVTALSRLQGELMASRLEVQGARGESVHLRGYLRHSQEAVESAHAYIGTLNAQAAVREAEWQAVLAQVRAEAGALRTELATIRASFSWRVARPVRAAGRVLRWMKRAARPGAPPAQPGAGAAVAPPPGFPDPNAPYLFKPAPFPVAGQEVVTVEELFTLSRSP